MFQSYLTGEIMTVAFGSYLLGCFTSGYYLVRWRMGQDIRQLGSGNVGARNVGRVLGFPGFLGTLSMDIAKGALAVWLTVHVAGLESLTGLAMVVVTVGHIWPFHLRFHGGKGVATSLGALAFYDIRLALFFVVYFCLALLLVRKTVLGGLVAFAILPFTSFLMGHEASKIFSIAVLAGLVVMAHRKNLAEEINEMARARTALSGRSNDESDS